MAPSSATSTLRDLPTSKRHFAQSSAAAQAALAVNDLVQYRSRPMSAGRLINMALNEVAVEHQRGFFLHLPPKNSWGAMRPSACAPEERQPSTPGSRYPDMVFVDFVWNANSCHNFFADTHRGRYLRSCAIANPPAPNTPLFAIQVASSTHSRIFATAPESLIVVITDSALYLLTTIDLEALSGRHVDGRLTVPTSLWNPAVLQTGKEAIQRQKMQVHGSIQRFALPDIDQVHRAILARCTGIGASTFPTFDAQTLQWSILPRPGLQAASAVGSALGTGLSAAPRSRRRKPPAGLRDSDADMEDEKRAGVEQGH